jgi:hypothetical protein
VFNLPLFILDEEELTEDTASVTFTLSEYTLPTTWTGLHLVIITSIRSAYAAAETDTNVRFNGDSGSNYEDQYLYAYGTASEGARGDSRTSMRLGGAAANSQGADEFGGGMIVIPDYAATTRHKAAVSIAGNSEDSSVLAVARWANTAAITTINLFANSSGAWKSASRFILALVDERYRIQQSVLASDAANIDFQNIPALDGSVVAICVARSAVVSTADNWALHFNGDTTDAHYKRQRVGASASSVTANIDALPRIGAMAADSSDSDAFGVVVASISQYARGENDPHTIATGGFHGGGNSQIELVNHRRNDVEAINRITFVPTSGSNLKQYSAVWLYHVPKPPIQRVEATGNVASYTFSDLPTGEALLITIYGRIGTAAATVGVDVEFNADTTAANYDRQRIEGDSTTVTETRSAAEQEHLEVPAASATANIFGGGTLLIPAFSKTDRHKHSLWIGGPGDDMVEFVSRRWENTAAITSVKLTPSDGDNFVDGTIIEISVVPTLASQTIATRATKTVQT